MSRPSLSRLHSSRAAGIVVQAALPCKLSIFVSDISLVNKVRLYRLLAAPPGSMAKPQQGDRILVLKPTWLEQILALKKTLEIRGSKLKPGRSFLGCGGRIYASALLDAAIAIETIRPNGSRYAKTIRSKPMHCPTARHTGCRSRSLRN